MNLPIHPCVSLLSMETARAVLGMSSEAVLARVDDGRLRWVWDISSHAGEAAVCEYRFWVRELVNQGETARLQPDQVVAQVIGTQRPRLARSELLLMLGSSKGAISQLVSTGHLQPDSAEPSSFVTRASLREFLRKRLVGNNN